MACLLISVANKISLRKNDKEIKNKFAYFDKTVATKIGICYNKLSGNSQIK